jgi:predicted HNH restriction endonuclease
MTVRNRQNCRNNNTRKCAYIYGMTCDVCENWKEKLYSFTRP